MDNPVAEKTKTPLTNFLVPGAIAVVVLIALVGYFFLTKGTAKETENKVNITNETASSSSQASSQNSQVTWMQTADGWQADGTPPACPFPLLKSPADTKNVTSILYPGQTRGGNYKPHGGFRFDNNKNNSVTVTSAMDSTVVRGGRYLVNGETQYTFDFMSTCGVMYRLGHLLVLDSKYQKIADQFPAAQEGDSRTERVNPPVVVTKGETVASQVGITKGGINVFFDFGVYDFKTKNKASQDAAWAASPMHDAELAQHALCWFDLLPSADATKVKSLPAGDPTSGKNSDFCK